MFWNILWITSNILITKKKKKKRGKNFGRDGGYFWLEDQEMFVERWSIDSVRHLSQILNDHLMSGWQSSKHMIILYSSKFSFSYVKMWKNLDSQAPLTGCFQEQHWDAFPRPVARSAPHPRSHHWASGCLEFTTLREDISLTNRKPGKSWKHPGAQSPCFLHRRFQVYPNCWIRDSRRQAQRVSGHIPKLCKLLAYPDFKSKESTVERKSVGAPSGVWDSLAGLLRSWVHMTAGGASRAAASGWLRCPRLGASSKNEAACVEWPRISQT